MVFVVVLWSRWHMPTGLIDLLTAMGRDYYEFVSIAPQEKRITASSILAGVVVTVPVAFYHIYAFCKAGSETEREHLFKMVMPLA